MATVHRRTTDKAASSGPDDVSMAAAAHDDNDRNGLEPTSSRRSGATTTKTTKTTTPARTIPSAHLPTPIETIALGLFPFILIFGTLFSVLSPHTRSAPYDAVTQSHSQDPSLAPSYFARKNNIFNVFFVKRGWAWTSFAFFFALLTQPQPAGRYASASSAGSGSGSGLGSASGGSGISGPGFSAVLASRARAGLRWALVTAYWIFVTQWFFGPPLIDRSFRLTGGRCEMAVSAAGQGDGSGSGSGSIGVEMFTSVACKTAGGRWKGGHDISGHVFLLVLGTVFLMHEIGWPALLLRSRRGAEERCVVMSTGAVEKIDLLGPGADAADEDNRWSRESVLGAGGKTAVAVICMNLWMLLMTAIYFHTWVEKFTGLLTAMAGVYAVYHVPRLVPSLRWVVGLPGI